MNDMTPQKMLTDVPTSEIHNELIRREGVSALFLGPEDKITKVVRGPAWAIINRD